MKRVLTAVIAAFLLTGTALAASPKRVLVFGDSNSWGWKPTEQGFPAERYGDAERWAGVLDLALPGVTVEVDGLVGRRSNIDGSNAVGFVEKDDFNGAKALPEAIARNMPLDLVIIMLGTNDLQTGTERPVEDVAAAVFRMADRARQADKPVYSAYPAPQVLVISPAVLGDTSRTPLSGLFQAGEQPSRMLPAAFAREATRHDIPFFNAAAVTATDGIDGIHFNKDNHKVLGMAMAPVVASILENRE
ncbi:GDSL-type esterase/lipase family protein [Spongorhabdus nitratireducens]